MNNDILHYFRRYLIDHHRIGTAARLLSANSAFYDFFLPAVDYEHLTIDRSNARQVVWGLGCGEFSSSSKLQSEIIKS